MALDCPWWSPKWSHRWFHLSQEEGQRGNAERSKRETGASLRALGQADQKPRSGLGHQRKSGR